MPRRFTVVDITGVHSVQLSMCNCEEAEAEPLQLLSLGLYPASTTLPRTAFMFHMLDDFLVANKISGIAAQS